MTERTIAAPDHGDVGGILYVVGSALAFGAMAVLARIAYRDGVPVSTMEGDCLRSLAELDDSKAMEVAAALAGRRVPVTSGFVGRTA